MPLGIIGRKIGMTHLFDEKGNLIPVSVIQAGPCTVVQKKTMAKDHYLAVQLGFEDIRESRVTKPLQGHFKRSGQGLKRTLREFRLTVAEEAGIKEGDAVTVKALEACTHVDVTGVSKGRGFTGVIKRHNFHMPKQTHGTHEKFRHGGSLGCRFPQHVVKGKKMAGQYGNGNVTMQNLKVVGVRPEENLILIRGAIPGAGKGIVEIRPALKKSPAA